MRTANQILVGILAPLETHRIDALPTLRVVRALRVSLRLAPPLARQSKRVEYYPPQ